jgi:hypothetical protein
MEEARSGYATSVELFTKEKCDMTQSQRQRERQWRQRKEAQDPHGKVKSFDQLAAEAGKTETDNHNK